MLSPTATAGQSNSISHASQIVSIVAVMVVLSRSLPYRRDRLVSRRPFEQVTHLAVGGRRKIVVPEADGEERLRRHRTDDFIRLIPEFLTGGGGADRDGDDEPCRLLPAERGGRGAHGSAGREAVVDQDHGAPAHLGR